jgi:hypothetical protein
MPTDYYQPLTDKLARINAQIAAAETEMLRTISIEEQCRLEVLMGALNLQREEIQAKLAAPEEP